MTEFGVWSLEFGKERTGKMNNTPTTGQYGEHERIPDTWPEATRGGERFSERTLRSLASFVRAAIFSQEFTGRRGLMQCLDARVKLLTIVAIIIAISLCRSPAHLAALCAITFFLAGFSRIPLKAFIKHVWLVVPLFSAAIALPALVLVPGDPLTGTFHIGAWSLAVTRQGAVSALMFVLRVGASVSFIELLALTTGWNSLMRALTALRVPAFFVMLIGITYRYLFYFLTFIEELHLGRKSRTLAANDSRTGRRGVASRIGFTLSRAMHMGDDVYEAMASRGFTGEARFFETSRPGIPDVLWTVGILSGLYVLYLSGGFG